MYVILIYGFPFILVLIEWAIRTFAKVDSSLFMGPALSVSGISYLVPLLRPKIAKGTFGFRSKLDEQLIPFTFIVIILSMFAWSVGCVWALDENERTYYGFRGSLLIGGFTYLISLILAFIKEEA